MRYFEKQSKKDKDSKIEINKNTILPAIAGASGLALTGKKIKDISTTEVKLNPKSNRIAVFYPGGGSGSGHKIPASEFIRKATEQGYFVDIYDTDMYQGPIAKKFITPQYIKTVSKDPISAMPSQTEVDPDVRLGKTKPLWQQLDDIEKKKGLTGSQKFMDKVKLEVWNAVAGHNKAEKEFKMKAKEGGGYQRVFSFFGPTADILKNTGIPVDVVQTDYIQNPMVWNTESAGRYFVPNKASKDRFKKIGIPDSKIVETGNLITKKEFSNPKKHFKMPDDMKAIKAKNPKARFVTITGGGMGINVEQLTEQASKYYASKDPNTYIVSIAGGNKDMYDSVQKKLAKGTMPNVISHNRAPFGDYMYHSEYSLIRPGGSTTAEALKLGKPVITVSQHDTPTDFSRMGAHEHGNIKELMDSKGAVHFKTDYDMKKYTPGLFNSISRFLFPNSSAKITNISNLDDALNNMETNYSTLKQNAEEASKKYRKIDPIKTILNTPVGPQRASSVKILDKFKLGAGVALAGAGGYSLYKNLTEKKAEKKEDTNYLKYVIPPVVATGIGAAAGHYIPGMRGGKGPILGSLIATKRLFGDLPLNIISGKKLGMNLEQVMFNAKKIERLKLTPTEIVNRGLKTADPSLPLKAQREATKHLDTTNTLNMIKEQEEVARKSGVEKMIGVSHFTPAQAARMGYTESLSMTPKATRALFGNKPFGYYHKGRQAAIQKLVKEGPDKLDAMDAYWLSADTKDLRLFEKDLRMSNDEAVAFAQQRLVKIPKEEISHRIKKEKEFKRKFDAHLGNIYK